MTGLKNEWKISYPIGKVLTIFGNAYNKILLYNSSQKIICY